MRDIITVSASGTVKRFTTEDQNISHAGWFSVQVTPTQVFQLYFNSTKCRMLEILQNNTYTVTPKANPDTERAWPALAAVTGGVLSIGG